MRDNKEYDEYGHFVIHPKKVKELNSQQKIVALRIYGPDEENFGLNMEMFAEAKRTPHVFALMPDDVKRTLRSNDKKFLARASWLDMSFIDDSDFCATACCVNYVMACRGVRRGIAEAFKR